MKANSGQQEREIKFKTKDAEVTILIGGKTKGIENAREGSKLTIEYNGKGWSDERH
jgi:hypothetical protein